MNMKSIWRLAVGLLSVVAITFAFAGTSGADPAPGDPADVSVVKTGPVTALADTDVTYSITVTNNGPDPADGVKLSDKLPSGTTLVSFVQDSGPPGGGTLPAGETQTFTFVVHVNPGTKPGTLIINTADVTSTTPDPDSSNNSSAVTTTIVAASTDLSVSASGTPNPVSADGDVTYTVGVTNNGPDIASNVSLASLLPAGTTFVSLSAPAGWTNTTPAVGGSGTVTSTVASLPVAISSFTLVVHVDATVAPGSTLALDSAVSSTTADPDPLNNSATAAVDVAQAAAPPSDPGTAPTGTATPPADDSGLPVTGASASAATRLGLMMIGLGLALVIATSASGRRRRVRAAKTAGQRSR